MFSSAAIPKNRFVHNCVQPFMPKSRAYLQPEALRRICVSLIRVEQERMLRIGAIQTCKLDKLHRSNAFLEDIDSVNIDLETLGFDSLALLDLIMSINRFFGLHHTGIEDYLLLKRRIGDWVQLLLEHFALAPDNFSMTFATSGSAGHAKQISHQFDRMRTEIDTLLAGPFRQLSSANRIIALVPPHHIYGFLFTALLPTVRKVAVVDLYHSGPGAAARVAKPGDLIVATPLNWRHLVQLKSRFCEGVHGVVSAGPSDHDTWRVLDECGLSTLTEVYGSTETLGVAIRTSESSSFKLMSHLSRVGDHVADCDGMLLELQDKLNWTGDRNFSLEGRLDSVVQVGGVNVNLTQVRDKILQIDGVDDAVVRLDQTRLKAFVKTTVHKDIHCDLDQRLRQELQCQLAAPAVPQSIVYGLDLPRNNMGKLCDWNAQEFVLNASIFTQK